MLQWNSLCRSSVRLLCVDTYSKLNLDKQVSSLYTEAAQQLNSAESVNIFESQDQGPDSI